MRFPSLRGKGSRFPRSPRIEARSSGDLAVVGVLSHVGQLQLQEPTAATIGAAGGAAALPATPLGYVIITLNAKKVKVPYYNP